MHEFGIIENIFQSIKKIAAENQLKTITKISLKIGKMRQLVPEFLQFAFQTLSKNSLASDAKLIIEEIPITIKCDQCNHTAIVEDLVFACPKCLANDVTIISGKELILESIEGE